jgi:hypothetical protein
MVTLETIIAMASKFWPAGVAFLIQTDNLCFISSAFV